MSEEQQRVYRVDEQEPVTFYAHAIVAARLDDGRIVVTIQSLCAGIEYLPRAYGQLLTNVATHATTR
jgi:hypothetical protein